MYGDLLKYYSVIWHTLNKITFLNLVIRLLHRKCKEALLI